MHDAVLTDLPGGVGTQRGRLYTLRVVHLDAYALAVSGFNGQLANKRVHRDGAVFAGRSLGQVKGCFTHEVRDRRNHVVVVGLIYPNILPINIQRALRRRRSDCSDRHETENQGKHCHYADPAAVTSAYCAHCQGQAHHACR